MTNYGENVCVSFLTTVKADMEKEVGKECITGLDEGFGQIYK